MIYSGMRFNVNLMGPRNFIAKRAILSTMLSITLAGYPLNLKRCGFKFQMVN